MIRQDSMGFSQTPEWKALLLCWGGFLRSTNGLSGWLSSCVGTETPSPLSRSPSFSNSESRRRLRKLMQNWYSSPLSKKSCFFATGGQVRVWAQDRGGGSWSWMANEGIPHRAEWCRAPAGLGTGRSLDACSPLHHSEAASRWAGNQERSDDKPLRAPLLAAWLSFCLRWDWRGAQEVAITIIQLIYWVLFKALKYTWEEKNG